MENNIVFAAECLKRDIERKMGRNMLTPADFNMLSLQIFSETNEKISPHTLMRLWGYVKTKSRPSLQTLSLLSRFAGHENFSKYLMALTAKKSEGSEYVTTDFILSEQLQPGDVVSLEWHPGRAVKLLYLGEFRYRVEENQNSRLEAGDELQCMSFGKCAPFIALILKSAHGANLNYIGGKEGGLTALSVAPENHARHND